MAHTIWNLQHILFFEHTYNILWSAFHNKNVKTFIWLMVCPSIFWAAAHTSQNIVTELYTGWVGYIQFLYWILLVNILILKLFRSLYNLYVEKISICMFRYRYLPDKSIFFSQRYFFKRTMVIKVDLLYPNRKVSIFIELLI